MQIMSQQTMVTSRELRDFKISRQPTKGTLKTTLLSLGFVQRNALTITLVVTELQTGHLVIL